VSATAEAAATVPVTTGLQQPAPAADPAFDDPVFTDPAFGDPQFGDPDFHPVAPSEPGAGAAPPPYQGSFATPLDPAAAAIAEGLLADASNPDRQRS
jgi:hypothetical protein